MQVFLIILAAVVVLLLAASLVAALYMYRFALDPKSDRSFAMDKPHNQFTPEQAGAEEERAALRAAWLQTMRQEELIRPSGDGLQLHAWRYTPADASPSHLWAIVCHGYGEDAPSMLGPARRLSQMGFNLLLPDARGHGKSEGEHIGMGWPERRDIVGWAWHIVKRDPHARILLYGISMGAATVMMTAGEADLPPNVKAVVEDCGYTSVWDEFAYQLKAVFRLPPFPVLYLTSLITRLRQGWGFKEASAVKQLAQSRLPLLCIHGTADTFVPTRMLDGVYAAAQGPRQRLLVEGAEHGAANVVGGDMYWDTVEQFVLPYMQ